jgi:hypothetical protein
MPHNELPDADYVDAACAALTRPSDFGYYGDKDLFDTWGMLPFMQHRDSDTLGRSNYRTILAYLQRAATSEDGDSAEDADEYVDDMRASCWAHGWREQILCRVLIDGDEPISVDNLTNTFKEAVEVAHGLSDYGIFDESDLSELESDESWEAFEQAWSDVDWDEISLNSADDAMKSYIYRQMIESETRLSFDSDEIAELVLDYERDAAYAEHAETYKDQLRLFELPLC